MKQGELVREVGVLCLVVVLGAAALCPIVRATWIIAGLTTAGSTPEDRALALGAAVAAAGLCAIVACLVLRLRNYNRDLVEPPALTGPIVIVALGAALALGAAALAR
jgi:hypothetical protein